MAQDKPTREPQPGQYKCQVCGKAFDTEEQLKEHNRKEHPEKADQPTTKR
jgi:hypothetical protein